MRKFLSYPVLFLLVALGFLMGATVRAQVPTLPKINGLSAARLSLSPDQKEYQAGEPVRLTITLANNSAKTLKFGATGQDWDFQIDVLKELQWPGSSTEILLIPVRWTAYGEKQMSPQYVYDRMVYRFMLVNVDPGKPFKQTLLLSRLFDLSESGVYHVDVRQRVQVDGKDEQLASGDYKINLK